MHSNSVSLQKLGSRLFQLEDLLTNTYGPALERWFLEAGKATH